MAIKTQKHINKQTIRLFFINIEVYRILITGYLHSHSKNMHSNNEELALRLKIILDTVYLANPATKGIAIHIESPKYNLSWNSAVGFANLKGKVLTAQMPANIASTTKTYIAAAILRITEEYNLKTSTPIAAVISEKSNALLTKAGYKTHLISVANLVTNTSGIYDYVNTQAYQSLTQSNPKHRWTRDEQIALAISNGNYIEDAGERFAYSETNYLLLTEIIEHFTKKPFHIAVRDLLKFNQFNLNHTWFLLQENKPLQLPDLVEQTATGYNVNSYTLDYSFDAFGGGGLASTVTDMANFSQHLFDGHIFNNSATKEKLFTTIQTKDGIAPTYSFGLMHTNVLAYKAYGHGGFWGTHLKYIPELNLSIGVYVLERDTWQVYNTLIDELVKEITK